MSRSPQKPPRSPQSGGTKREDTLDDGTEARGIDSSNVDSPNSQGLLVTLRPHISHFWVSSSPFFSTTLLFEPLREAVVVRLFDADGAQFNELSVHFESEQLSHQNLGLLDLEPCMAACKFESGLKHARVEVASSQPITVLARIHSRDWASVIREAIPCSAMRKFIVPFFCHSEKTSIIAILNKLDQPVEVRGRLFIGKRSPEIIWNIPALGTRFFDTKQEFSEVIEQSAEAGQGYVRLSVVGDEEVFIHTLEASSSPKQPRYFSFTS